MRPDEVVAPTVLGCAGDDPRTLATLSTAQLCSLWRKSAAGLVAAAGVEARLEVVSARAALLAELERRQPVPMAAWLAAGAREPGGPPAYLLGVANVSSRNR